MASAATSRRPRRHTRRPWRARRPRSPARRCALRLRAGACARALAGATATLAGEVAGLGVDAFTANPLLGADSLEPFVASGAGVFVLVRTSNPGAADVQDLERIRG